MLSPIYIPGEYYRTVLYGEDPPLPPNPCDDSGARRLQKGGRNKECAATWDINEYRAWLEYVESLLSKAEFDQYKSDIRKWQKSFGKDWKYGGAW